MIAEDIVDKELVVQRLLDVRFVSDVLLGGSFSDDFGPTAAAAAELLGEPNNDEAQRKWRTTKEKPVSVFQKQVVLGSFFFNAAYQIQTTVVARSRSETRSNRFGVLRAAHCHNGTPLLSSIRSTLWRLHSGKQSFSFLFCGKPHFHPHLTKPSSTQLLN